MDATQFYFREIRSDSAHPNYYETTFSQKEIDKYLTLFQLIYNLHIPETDSIFHHYGIHISKRYRFREVTMGVDSSIFKYPNILALQQPTDYKALDNILETFNYQLVKSKKNRDYSYLKFTSDTEINPLPFLQALSNLPETKYAEMNMGFNNGIGIEIAPTPYYTLITFRVGWGDCPSGCIHNRYWEFAIMRNKARFVRAYQS